MLTCILRVRTQGVVVSLPVRVVGGSVREVEVRGLEGLSIDRSRVTLALRGNEGVLEVPARLERIGPVSVLQLRPADRHLRTLARLFRAHLDRSREIPTRPETPSALRRAPTRGRERG